MDLTRNAVDCCCNFYLSARRAFHFVSVQDEQIHTLASVLQHRNKRAEFVEKKKQIASNKKFMKDLEVIGNSYVEDANHVLGTPVC